MVELNSTSREKEKKHVHVLREFSRIYIFPSFKKCLHCNNKYDVSNIPPIHIRHNHKSLNIVTITIYPNIVTIVFLDSQTLLTPHVQLLWIPHIRATFIWLCGPISGMLIQIIMGYHNDRCTSCLLNTLPLAFFC